MNDEERRSEVKTLEVDAQNCEPYVYTNYLKIRTHHKLVFKKKKKKPQINIFLLRNRLTELDTNTQTCVYVYVMYT